MLTIMQKHHVITSRHLIERKICVSPVPEYNSAAIKAVRKKLELTQAAFASILNTSLSTVKQWELGRKRPSGTSAKLLDVLSRKGLEALI
jgi:putative transcriptional regulator